MSLFILLRPFPFSRPGGGGKRRKTHLISRAFTQEKTFANFSNILLFPPLKRTILLQHVFSPKEIVKYFLLYFLANFSWHNLFRLHSSSSSAQKRRLGWENRKYDKVFLPLALLPLLPHPPSASQLLEPKLLPTTSSFPKNSRRRRAFPHATRFGYESYFLLFYTEFGRILLSKRIISYKPTHLMHFNICTYIKCIFHFPHNPKVAYINRYAVCTVYSGFFPFFPVDLGLACGPEASL